MRKKKQFKIVFTKESNTYAVQFIDNKGEWATSVTYSTFDMDGKLVQGPQPVGLLNEDIIWDIQQLAWLGYEFLGVETVDAA